MKSNIVLNLKKLKYEKDKLLFSENSSEGNSNNNFILKYLSFKKCETNLIDNEYNFQLSIENCS